MSAAVLSANDSLSARHTSNLINGFYWLKQVRIVQLAAEKLGKADKTKKWGSIYENGVASYNKNYYDKARGLYRDIECGDEARGQPCHSNERDGYLSSQTANALPLALNIASNPKRVGESLANDVLTGLFPGCTDTGLVGTKFVFSALVESGHADVALKVVLGTSYPSYGRMLPPPVSAPAAKACSCFVPTSFYLATTSL